MFYMYGTCMSQNTTRGRLAQGQERQSQHTVSAQEVPIGGIQIRWLVMDTDIKESASSTMEIVLRNTSLLVEIQTVSSAAGPKSSPAHSLFESELC